MIRKYNENCNTNVAVQNRYTRFNHKKKKIYCCLLDHTVKHALQSHPQKLKLKNLLAGRTKTLSFRQDLLPLSGIAEAVNGEEGKTSGGVRE